MKADKQTEREIMDAVDRLKKAYERRDMDEFVSCFVPDADAVMYGTGADEKRIGLPEIEEQARRDWAQADSTSFDIGWCSTHAAGPVAWFAADTAFIGKVGSQEFRMPARWTAVFERRDNRWLIAQAHFSVAAAAQEEGQSFPQ